MTTSLPELAGAFAVALASIEGMKYVAGKVASRVNGSSDEETTEARTLRLIRDLHTWHNVRDGEGTPLWYTPRRLFEEQNTLLREILSELRRARINGRG